MITTEAIKALADYLRNGVCKQVEYLRVNAGANVDLRDLKRELAAPVVYEGSFPHRYAEHERKTDKQLAPSIVVSNGNAAELRLKHGIVSMPIVLHLKIWSPGFIDEQGNYVADECWHDIANFTDEVVDAIAEDMFPGGLNLDGDISFQLDDFFDTSEHPLYDAIITFNVTHGRALNRDKN